MNGCERRTQKARHLVPLLVALGILAAAVPPGDAADTCLVSVHDDNNQAISNGGSVCQNASGTSCTFKLTACVNDVEAGCNAGLSKKKKIHAKGHCGGIGKLQVGASSGQSCGLPADIRVHTKKHGKKPGLCSISISVKTKDGRSDKDQFTLTCNPSSGPQCPATTSTTTTTTTIRSVTSTTMGPCSPPPTGTSTCAPIVAGSPIAGTYAIHGTTGEKRCTTNAASNRFGTCNTDTDCGGTSGSCLNLPWVTADGEILPFPTGTATTFTVNAEGSFPTCAHNLCIPCGNPNAACAGIPGCQVAGNPNGCIPRATLGCCDQPGFIVPTFTVPLLGGLCSRVDQYDCGVGIINTSNPQTGDLNVKKQGDTSDPGADCIYGTGDDPPHKPCTAALTGEGGDLAGKIVTTYGDGTPDPNGIQYRLQTPELSTTWMDGGDMTNGCVDGTFDNGEGLVSQLLLKAEPTTAGATGQFTDQNGDSCSRVGSGFTPALPDGPITVPGGASGPARPQPYNGSAGSVAAAVSEVFSGPSSPLHDIGFVAITPNSPIAPACQPVACTCTPQPACPE